MSTLDLVLDRGVLRVAVAYTPPPEEGSHPEFYLHPKTGEPSGVVCELSRIMAWELGVRPEFVDLAWSQHMKALLDGDVDLLMSYTNTPERALHVDFAGPLLPSDIVVMVRNEGGIESTAALDEPSSCIGVEKGSSIVRVAQRHFPCARVLESTAPAPALKNGEIDAWVTDAVTRIFMKQNLELGLLRERDGRLLVLAREYGHPAGCSRQSEKVERHQVVCMIIKKAPPSRGRWGAMANHILGDGGLGNGDAQLRQLAMHAGSSPERVGPAHVPYQLTYFGSDAWSSGPTPSALPRPISSEPTTVPADDRLRFHDDEDTLPVSPDSAQQHPKHAVDIREPRPFHRTTEDGELLPKSDILESQLATSLEGRDESGNQRRNHAGMVLADRRLIKFGARG